MENNLLCFRNLVDYYSFLMKIFANGGPIQIRQVISITDNEIVISYYSSELVIVEQFV